MSPAKNYRKHKNHVYFTGLNNKKSRFYKKKLKQQVSYMKSRLLTFHPAVLMDLSRIQGTPKGISTQLMYTAAKLVQMFFKTEKQCDICCAKNTVLHRSHANILGGTRPEILQASILDLWQSPRKSIRVASVLSRFIEKHEAIPVYSLCRKCHMIYDTHYTFHDSKPVKTQSTTTKTIKTTKTQAKRKTKVKIPTQIPIVLRRSERLRVLRNKRLTEKNECGHF